MSSERAMDKEKYSEEENAPTALDDYDTSSENHSLKIDFPSGGTSLEKSQYIVTKISEIGASSNFKVTFHYLKKLEEIVKSNPKDNEIFYCSFKFFPSCLYIFYYCFPSSDMSIIRVNRYRFYR